MHGLSHHFQVDCGIYLGYSVQKISLHLEIARFLKKRNLPTSNLWQHLC